MLASIVKRQRRLWPLVVLTLLCWASPVLAQQAVTNPVSLEWDATPNTQGYRLLLDGAKAAEGPTTSATVTVPGGVHVATVRAFNIFGESPDSAPLSFQVGDPCAVPLGNRAVSIFPGALHKTGSKGAGSLAWLEMQVASPNSPITRVAVRTQGQDLRAISGDVAGSGSIWFTIPATAGSYPLTVLATNQAGCSNEVSAHQTVTVTP